MYIITRACRSMGSCASFTCTIHLFSFPLGETHPTLLTDAFWWPQSGELLAVRQSCMTACRRVAVPGVLLPSGSFRLLIMHADGAGYLLGCTSAHARCPYVCVTGAFVTKHC